MTHSDSMRNPTTELNSRKKALQIIVLFGLVSLFGDIVYESSRSVSGPYLKLLAANAAVVGLIAGMGEFIGYALRLLSGYLSDRAKTYWLFTFLGYGLIIFVPLLSLAGIWQVAAICILMERLGKAMRSPARDAILSSASKQVGTGFGFGLHEALDQLGAIAGPLIFAIFFALGTTQKGILDYQRGYKFLWIPFFMLILCIFLAYLRLPHPERLESSQQKETQEKFSRLFWLYSIFIFITTLGFANFVLIGYHFKSSGIISDAQIPLFYVLAMGMDAIAALGIGRMYDLQKARKKDERAGLDTLLVIPVLSLFIPAAAFSKTFSLCLVGTLIWGIVMGSHETIMRSAIADITPLKKRGAGYGLLNTNYGISLFFGSVLFGFLYSSSIASLIVVAVILQLLAILVFLKMKKERARRR